MHPFFFCYLYHDRELYFIKVGFGVSFFAFFVNYCEPFYAEFLFLRFVGAAK